MWQGKASSSAASRGLSVPPHGPDCGWATPDKLACHLSLKPFLAAKILLNPLAVFMHFIK
jgi:hypothetical protein